MNAVSTWRTKLVLLLSISDLLAPCSATRVALAQDPPWPRCSERLDGQSLCSQGSICDCHYDAGGALTGRVAAWRWSCDILRMCGAPVPAGIPDQALPPGFTYAPNMSASPDATQQTPPARQGPHRWPGPAPP